VTDSLSRLKILQRIMGRARPSRDAAAETDADRFANRDLDSGEHASLAASDDEGFWDADAAEEGEAGQERPAHVPAFFNRPRK
jgi:hypothetical protein